MTWAVAEGTVDGDDGVRAENAGRVGLLHDGQCIHRVQSHSFEEKQVDDGVEEEEDCDHLVCGSSGTGNKARHGHMDYNEDQEAERSMTVQGESMVGVGWT